MARFSDFHALERAADVVQQVQTARLHPHAKPFEQDA